MTKGNKSNNNKTAAKQNKQKNKVSDEILEKAAEVYFFYQDNPEYSDVMLQLAFEPPYKNKSFVQWVTPLKDGTTLWDKMQKEMDRRLKDPIARAAAEKFTSRIVSNELKEQAVATRTRTNKSLPIVSTEKAINADYPIDKPNQHLWNNFKADDNGQLSFDFVVGKQGNQNATALFCIDFDLFEKEGITLSKSINHYDKRVYIAANAQFQKSKAIDRDDATITLKQIYAAMGNNKKPSAYDMQKLNDSLTKLGFTHLYYDNEIEAAAFKSKPHLKYDGALLPFERVSVVIGGNVTDAAIHIFREPPLITFAKEREQITTIPVGVFQTPISQTETALQVQDYLIERITAAKNKRSSMSNTILFERVFERCKIDKSERVKRQRVIDMINKCMKHYVEETHHIITKYEPTKANDGIIFYW